MMAHRSGKDRRTKHNRVFHRVSIGGLTFKGIVMLSGPTLLCQAGGAVAFGVCSLRQFKPDTAPSRSTPAAFGWWVVKDHDEARIALPGFTSDGVQRLADAFGLLVLTEQIPHPADHLRQSRFFASPAWHALRQWTIQHPWVAKGHAADDTYLPGWYARARALAAAAA